MTKPTADQIDRLRVGIDDLVRRFKIAEAAPSAGSHVRLNPIDIQALLFIADNPASTARALGQHLGVVPTTTSALVDRLVRQGLLLRERTETNRRVVSLTLSAEGMDAAQQIVEVQSDHCRQMLEALEPEERQQLVAAIAKIANTRS